jgi:zinc protease
MNRILIRVNLTIGVALLASGAARLMAADELPKAAAIIDKYVEVTGGKAAYQKTHSSIQTGSMEIGAMGLKGKVTTYHVEPNLTYTEVELEGMGKITDGSDGKVAWSNSAMQGPHVKEGNEKAQAMRSARFNAELNWRDSYKTAETKGVESVEGKDCYKVVLTPEEGSAVTRFYDKESGLLLKESATMQSPMGEVQVDSYASDYRKEGDILLAHKLKQSFAGQEFTVSIDSVKFNPEIAKDRFELPDEIKALVNKK